MRRRTRNHSSTIPNAACVSIICTTVDCSLARWALGIDLKSGTQTIGCGSAPDRHKWVAPYCNNEHDAINSKVFLFPQICWEWRIELALGKQPVHTNCESSGCGTMNGSRCSSLAVTNERHCFTYSSMSLAQSTPNIVFRSANIR